MLESIPPKDDLYGQQTIMEPSPKENKGSFFFLANPDHIGSAVFIPRDHNQFQTDFQLFDHGTNRFTLYMMNQVATQWEPKLLCEQNIWLNFNEHTFVSDDPNFKNVVKSVQYKQGLLQRFQVFHFNPAS